MILAQRGYQANSKTITVVRRNAGRHAAAEALVTGDHRLSLEAAGGPPTDGDRFDSWLWTLFLCPSCRRRHRLRLAPGPPPTRAHHQQWQRRADRAATWASRQVRTPPTTSRRFDDVLSDVHAAKEDRTSPHTTKAAKADDDADAPADASTIRDRRSLPSSSWQRFRFRPSFRRRRRRQTQPDTSKMTRTAAITIDPVRIP